MELRRSLMRISLVLFPVLLVSAALTGCGDDNVSAPNDGCTGHLCGGGSASLTDPEGGNVIFEYIYFDHDLSTAFGLPSGVTTVNRVMGYFMDNQTPTDNPLPAAGVCNNLESTKGWPLYVGTPHTDLDMGSLTITGANGAGTTYADLIPNMGAGTDSIGRKHDIYYQTIKPSVDDYIKTDQAYDVAWGGAGTIPATTYTGGLFMPATFQVSDPGLEDNSGWTAGVDKTVHWTPATSANLPAGDEVLGVTWLVDAAGSPTHMCPTAHSAGQFTIPGSALTEYKAIATARGTPTNKMILLRNAIVHHVVRLPNGENDNKRRLDLLSVMCWAQLVDLN